MQRVKLEQQSPMTALSPTCPVRKIIKGDNSKIRNVRVVFLALDTHFMYTCVKFHKNIPSGIQTMLAGDTIIVHCLALFQANKAKLE